ncbi:MAG: hypothetical protein Q7S52_03235 [bacterium]|nr:hypothetical protein [bacterium]
MRREGIISRLKTYQHTKKNPHLLQGLTECFLADINARITERHGKCAECAVRKVLEKMHADTLYPALCLDAMLELCRDDSKEFFEWQDADLISRINMDCYFSSMTLRDVTVETQEGVV